MHYCVVGGHVGLAADSQSTTNAERERGGGEEGKEKKREKETEKRTEKAKKRETKLLTCLATLLFSMNSDLFSGAKLVV